MIIMGAALIIRPRDRAAPQPWEMGTMEVEMEEELTREAMGITEEEELATLSSPSSISDFLEETSENADQDLTEGIDEPTWDPDISVGEILSSKSEEIDLEDLNTLADGLEDDLTEDDEIDTSFIDDL
jgi:superfamily I DNA/RNA helicase